MNKSAALPFSNTLPRNKRGYTTLGADFASICISTPRDIFARSRPVRSVLRVAIFVRVTSDCSPYFAGCNAMNGQKVSTVSEPSVKLAKLKNLTWCARNCALCVPLCREKLIGSFGAREMPFSRNQEHIMSNASSAWNSVHLLHVDHKASNVRPCTIKLVLERAAVSLGKYPRSSLTRNKRAPAAVRHVFSSLLFIMSSQLLEMGSPRGSLTLKNSSTLNCFD